MREKIPHVKAGDELSADLFNAIIDRLERFRNLSVSGPYLSLLEGPHGKTLNLALPRPMWVRLSGSGNPYSWQLVQWDDTAGSWVDVSAANSTGDNAYELNGATGLDGKIAELKWTTAGDYRFQAKRYAPPTISWTFNVRGCVNVGLAGATVELYQSGVLIDSCITADGTGGTTLGRCVLSVPAGTYDVVVTGPTGAGFAVNTSSQAITTTKTTTISLLADSDHVCTCCNLPVPKVLHSTDADGPIALTYTGSGAVWELVSTTPVSITCLPTGSASEPCINCESPSTALKRYVLSFQLIAGVCVARLQIYSGAICCENQTYLGNGDPPGTLLVLVSSNVTCDPLGVSFSVPTTVTTGGCASTGTPGGGGAMEFTP